MEMEDRQIVELYWIRDPRAVSETQAKYGVWCRRIAENILGDIEDARECENDTYMRAWSTIPPQRPETLGPYLGKIVRNLSLNMLSMGRADKRGGGQAPLVLDEISDIVSGSWQAEDALEGKELIETIEEFLKRAGREKRRVFLLRYWYFESVGSIAAKTGRTENSVSVTLSRMRAKLKKFLIERGYNI